MRATSNPGPQYGSTSAGVCYYCPTTLVSSCLRMHFALLRAGGSTQGPVAPWRGRLWLLALLSLLSPAPLCAESAAPNPGERGFPAVIRVGVPVPLPAPFVVSAGAGYGRLDDSESVEGGHRLRSGVAGAFSIRPNLGLGVDLRGVWDSYSDLSDSATKLYGEPRVTARWVQDGNRSTAFGAELDLRLIGAEAPSIEWAATTPTLRGLLGTQISPSSWLAANLGFSLDRSSKAIPDPERLSSADKRTLGAASANSIHWGVGASHRLKPELELLGELSGELLVGSEAPAAVESPARLSIGARRQLSDAWSILASAELGLSARPDPLDAALLMPLDPRVGAGLTLIWQLGQEQPRPRPVMDATTEPGPEPEVEPEVPVPATPDVHPEPARLQPIAGTVVDEGGRPMPDVEVSLLQEGDQPLLVHTLADGSFEITEAPEGPLTLRVETPGFDPSTVDVGATREGHVEIVLRPAVPAGQVRGKVVDLGGRAIAAMITVSPGDQVISVSADGSFELELPPGDYSVEFEHQDYSTQRRTIHVADRGVVILNIALTR